MSKKIIACVSMTSLLTLSGCVGTTTNIRSTADSAPATNDPSKSVSPPAVTKTPIAPQEKTVLPEQPKPSYPDGASDGVEYGTRVNYDCLPSAQLTIVASNALEKYASGLNSSNFEKGAYIQDGKKKIANMRSRNGDSNCRVPQLLGFKMKFLLSDRAYDFGSGRMTITAHFDELDRRMKIYTSMFSSSFNTGKPADVLRFTIPNQQIGGINFPAGKFHIKVDGKVTASIKLSIEDSRRVLSEGRKGGNGAIEYEGVAIYKPYDRFGKNEMYHFVADAVAIDVKPYKFILNNFKGSEKYTITFN